VVDEMGFAVPSLLTHPRSLTARSCSYGRIFAFSPFTSDPHGPGLAYCYS